MLGRAFRTLPCTRLSADGLSLQSVGLHKEGDDTRIVFCSWVHALGGAEGEPNAA